MANSSSMSNFGASPGKSPRYRVGIEGSDPTIVTKLSEQFGFDINKLGNATAVDAHDLRVYANGMKVQVDIAKSLLASIQTITDCTVQIEVLRKEAIEASLKRREEIEKMVGQLELTLSGLKTLRFCGQNSFRQNPKSDSRYGCQRPST